MCEPTLIISGVLGGLQAVTGIQEQNRMHAARVAAVQRENQIARQEYIQELQIAEHDDMRKGQVFKAQLEAAAASKTAYHRQRNINQQEASRASTAAQMELNSKVKDAQFKQQENLAKSIRAQGTVLASGMQAGQSMLLELQQAERELGFAQAEIDSQINDYEQAYAMQEYDIALSQYSADAEAMNQIQSAPLAPSASFAPIRPIKKEAPSKPSSLIPILQGATTGVTSYGNLGYEGRQFGKWPTG